MVSLSAKLWPVLTLLLCLVRDGKSADCPQRCTCIFGFVSCYNFTDINFEHLPEDTNTIVLHGGRLKSFPPQFLKNAPNVQLLEIQACEVEVILPETFTGVTALEQLAISDCKIERIQRDAFSDLTALSQLFLSKSDIGTIQSGAFSRMNDVGDLSMWSNKISTIERAAFRNLSDFHALSFYLNNVTLIAPDAFDQIERFSKVEIYLNRFESIAMGSAYPLNRAAGEINVYSNTFPCDCGIVDMLRNATFARFFTSNRCLRKNGRGGTIIVPLNELAVSDLDACEDRVSIATSSTAETTATTTASTATRAHSHSHTSQATTTDSATTASATMVTSHASRPKERSTGSDVTPTGYDITTRGSPRSSTTAGGRKNNGDSDKQSSRNPGNSGVSQATIVTVFLNVISVVVAAVLVGP